MRKIKNLKIDFYEAMRRFHGEGFGILGAFIFGFDYENKEVFEQTFEFIIKGGLDCVQLRILTPLPGTRLYTRLLSEGRLFEPDWWLRGYPPDTLLFQPKSMTADELISGYARLNRQTYSSGCHAQTVLWHEPLETDSTRLFNVRRHQYLYPQPLFQRPEEAPAICRGCQRQRRALGSF